MVTYRDFIATPQDKAYYIRRFLGIAGPKSSTEYRTAYRYLSLIQQGKRSGERGRFAPVVKEAKRLAELENNPPAPPPGQPVRTIPRRIYIPGMVRVIISNDESFRRDFGLDVDLDDRSGEYAAADEYISALEAAFTEQTGQTLRLYAADGGPVVDADARPVY